MTGWSNLDRGRKVVILWCGFFSALVAAFFSLGQALKATEPYHPATHGYVRDEITKTTDTLVKSQVEGQIETVEVRRAMVDKEQFELDIMLRNASSPPMPDLVRATLELRKRALDDDRKNLDYRLDTLQRARSGRRP